jgi:acyl transferase domain-containing protein
MSNDIAIIGLAGLFPGAKDIHAYWYNIINKVDNIKEAPDDWAVPYFDPNSQPREDPARIYTRKVGLLGELAEFNPLEFGIPPSSVEGDPSHFLALKMARDALKDAGYLDKSFNREKAGIILGRGSFGSDCRSDRANTTPTR